MLVILNFGGRNKNQGTLRRSCWITVCCGTYLLRTYSALLFKNCFTKDSDQKVSAPHRAGHTTKPKGLRVKGLLDRYVYVHSYVVSP